MQKEKLENKIHLVNGPNLNLLGKREESIYGSKTLVEIESELLSEAKQKNIELKVFQSNHEGEIISFIQYIEMNGQLIINAAAYTHTSVAIRDAILARKLKVAEVHLSNVYKREEFRHHSFLSDIAEVVICGAGDRGYFYALDYFVK